MTGLAMFGAGPGGGMGGPLPRAWCGRSASLGVVVPKADQDGLAEGALAQTQDFAEHEVNEVLSTNIPAIRKLP